MLMIERFCYKESCAVMGANKPSINITVVCHRKIINYVESLRFLPAVIVQNFGVLPLVEIYHVTR